MWFETRSTPHHGSRSLISGCLPPDLCVRDKYGQPLLRLGDERLPTWTRGTLQCCSCGCAVMRGRCPCWCGCRLCPWTPAACNSRKLGLFVRGMGEGNLRQQLAQIWVLPICAACHYAQRRCSTVLTPALDPCRLTLRRCSKEAKSDCRAASSAMHISSSACAQPMTGLWAWRPCPGLLYASAFASSSSYSRRNSCTLE